MKLIVQEHSMGCGVACVASATNKTYKEALSFVDAKCALNKGYWCKDLVEALDKMGFEYDYKKVTPKTLSLVEMEGSIVFIAYSDKYPAGHYLLKTKKGWMNPWINFPHIAPAKAGFEKELPGSPKWVIFRKQ